MRPPHSYSLVFHQVIEEEFKEILVPVIVSELHLTEIQGKLLGRDTVMFEELTFGITPKPFQTVDMHLAAGETLSMIDFQIPVAPICRIPALCRRHPGRAYPFFCRRSRTRQVQLRV